MTMAKICALTYGLGFIANVAYYTPLIHKMVKEDCQYWGKEYTAPKAMSAVLSGCAIGITEGVMFPLKIFSVAGAGLMSNGSYKVSPLDVITVPICISDRGLYREAFDISHM